MLVVIDTNIFISGLLRSGITSAILKAFLNNKFQLVVSEAILAEIDTTARKTRLAKFISPADLTELLELLVKKARIVKPAKTIRICRDPADNMILECALGNADIILTRDDDLLSLTPFHGIDILSPEKFLTKLRERRI